MSVQYKHSIEDSLDFKIIANISPQILSFDSTGKCMIQSTSEHLFSLGKPKAIKIFEDEIRLTYFVNNLNVTVLRILQDKKEYIYLKYENTHTSILFVR